MSFDGPVAARLHGGGRGGCAKCVLSIEGGGEEEGYLVSQQEGFLMESFF